MASPAKPLPADLEDFMQSSGDDGVIFISFGSMVDSFQNDVIKAMSGAFSQLPQKVLWRLNVGELLINLTQSSKNKRTAFFETTLTNNYSMFFLCDLLA